MKKNGTLVLLWATTIAVERRREGPSWGRHSCLFGPTNPSPANIC
ncbi:hypothetical protein AtDm6_2906 [Acetobacter tropicalis]|uniref:Uncharacterized protein n=1 Tax=Acetobacter tropicalis TaxID=104102 RepID=A0A094YGZ5_9PROT|nr:hypothetical protein AtDm6_2906 [Acetobacter tropicalis]